MKLTVFAFSLVLQHVASFQAVLQRRLTTTSCTSKTCLQMTEGDRRVFLSSSVAAITGAIAWFPSVAHAEGGSLDYKLVANDIEELIKSDPNKGPTLIRLAWHSCGSYDKATGTGGSNGGTLRFKEELAHGGNAGLAETAVAWMEPIHEKYAADGLSYGDLYTLGGVVSIKAMGGPTIPWSHGRVDALDASAVTPDGRLPNADSGPPGSDKADAQHLRDVFYRMGFNDQEIVCLSGAHAVGRCHTTASGYDGPWTFTPTTFNNAYYTIMATLKWIPKEWDGPFQYVDAITGRLMMLPSDIVLLEDRKFAKWMKVYAIDAPRFYEDFSKAFQKLEELGTSNLVPTDWA